MSARQPNDPLYLLCEQPARRVAGVPFWAFQHWRRSSQHDRQRIALNHGRDCLSGTSSAPQPSSHL